MTAHESMLRISNILSSERSPADMVAAIDTIVEQYESNDDEYDADDSDLDSDLEIDSDLDEEFEDD